MRLSGSDKAVRLSQRDRAFLCDLSKVGIIDADTAAKHHYSDLKGGSERSLCRLKEAGLLSEHNVVIDGKPVKSYTFASSDIARAHGSKVPAIGSRRMAFHEVVTSRVYFDLGKPDDFRLAHDFNKNDKKLFGATAPDAMYTSSDGEVVFVEADSGHYTSTQIKKKMAQWRHVKQVWGQPSKPSFRVPARSNVTVLNV